MSNHSLQNTEEEPIAVEATAAAPVGFSRPSPAEATWHRKHKVSSSGFHNPDPANLVNLVFRVIYFSRSNYFTLSSKYEKK